MARAIALARSVRAVPLEAVRLGIVYGCALALIAAARALPAITF
jgi:hypothetical protein